MKIRLFVEGCRVPIVLLALAAVFTISPSALLAQAPAATGAPPPSDPTAAEMKGKTASQIYKNVKVLSDAPAAEIHPAMEYITTALGAPCEFCHLVPNFDSDDKKEKNVARSMMKMTIALNATVFDGKREITCFTCHRGESRGAPTLVFPGEKSPTEKTARGILPALEIHGVVNIESGMSPSKAPETIVSGPPAAPKPMATPVALPTVEDVLSKYAQALGGTAAIDKVKSLVEKGTVEMLVQAPQSPGAPPTPPAVGTIPAEIDRKVPGKVTLSIQTPGRTRIEGIEGTLGWTSAPRREKTGGELVLQEEFAEFPAGLKFPESHSHVLVDALEKIGDRDAYRMVGTRSDGTTVDRLYFDAQNGLLLRSYSTMESILGAYPEETNYEDYRDAGGIKVPFMMRKVSPEGNRTYKWSQVDANVPIDDARFRMPPPPPK